IPWRNRWRRYPRSRPGRTVDDPSCSLGTSAAARDIDNGLRDDVIAEAVLADHLEADLGALERGHLAGEGEGVVGVERHTEAQRNGFHHRARARPVGDE